MTVVTAVSTQATPNLAGPVLKHLHRIANTVRNGCPTSFHWNIGTVWYASWTLDLRPNGLGMWTLREQWEAGGDTHYFTLLRDGVTMLDFIPSYMIKVVG